MARETTVKLYQGVGLTVGSEDTFYFDSDTAQNAYFESKKVYTLTGMIYQREGRNAIRVNYPIGNLRAIDYLSFYNDGIKYERKLYYAFVTDIVYISDTVTELVYTIDIMQTFLKNYTLYDCFIERMHTDTDVAGDNIVADDAFELGEYVVNAFKDFNGSASTVMCVIIEAAIDLPSWITSNYQTRASVIRTKNRNGIFSTTSVVAIPVSYQPVETVTKGLVYANVGSVIYDLMTALAQSAGGVTVNDIISMWVYPYDLLAGTETDVPGKTAGEVFSKYKEVNGATAGFNYSPFNYPTELNGYAPKNKKLLTFPYCQLCVENNNGSVTNYRFEYFRNTYTGARLAPVFRIEGTTTAEAKFRATPTNYKGLTNPNYDYSESIDSASFPAIPYSGDAYNIWLAQNRNTIQNSWEQINTNTAIMQLQNSNQEFNNVYNGVKGVVNNALTLNVAGAAESAEGMVLNEINRMNNEQIQIMQLKQSQNNLVAAREDAKLKPATVKGVVSQGIAYQHQKYMTFTSMCIDRQHAEMIDGYYTMYGYPIRKITTPSFKNRAKFTYIKTVGAHLNTQAVPEKYKRQIESILDNGIRFWCDPINIGNYAVNNAPLH